MREVGILDTLRTVWYIYLDDQSIMSNLLSPVINFTRPTYNKKYKILPISGFFLVA